MTHGNKNVGWVSDSVTQQSQNHGVSENMSGYAALTRPTSDISREWIQTNIGFVCELNPKDKLQDDLDVAFMPMAGVPIEFLGKPEYEVRKWQQVKKGYTQFKDGDTLFAKITPCFENGKACIADGFPNGWGAGSTEYFVLRPINNLVHPKLLLALVKTKGFLLGGAINMTGSVGHKRVPKEFVENYPLPLPPLAEQNQIADKLDELLAQVDSIKTRLDAIPNILKRFRQSVLAAAVNGRLTEDWREFNSVTQLEFDTYLLDSLPVSWRCVPLGDYVENHDNNRVPISSTERQNRKGKYPYYGASGQIDTIDGYTHDGDFILIGEDGANLLTRTKPIAFSVQGKVWVNNHAHVLKCKDGYENKYFEYFINSINLAQWVSGSAQPKLNQKNMNEIPISVPPKQEQTEIVRRVEQIFTYAAQIEQRVKDAQARINHLTQSILAKAFRGELTADWRAQNPDLITGENSAEALLARIQAARTVEKPKLKRKLKP